MIAAMVLVVCSLATGECAERPMQHPDQDMTLPLCMIGWQQAGREFEEEHPGYVVRAARCTLGRRGL